MSPKKNYKKNEADNDGSKQFNIDEEQVNPSSKPKLGKFWWKMGEIRTTQLIIDDQLKETKKNKLMCARLSLNLVGISM